MKNKKNIEKFNVKLIIMGIIILVLLIGVVLIILSIINREKEVVCKYTTSDPAGVYNMDVKYTIKYKKDNVVGIEEYYIYKAEDHDTLSELRGSIGDSNMLYNTLYGGIDTDIKNIDDALEVTTNIDYTKLDIKKYYNDMGLSDYLTEDKVNIENAIKMYKDSGAICEE